MSICWLDTQSGGEGDRELELKMLRLWKGWLTSPEAKRCARSDGLALIRQIAFAALRG